MAEERSGPKKQHRYRKNGRSREQWQERKAAANAARGKNHWNGKEWERV